MKGNNIKIGITKTLIIAAILVGGWYGKIDFARAVEVSILILWIF